MDKLQHQLLRLRHLYCNMVDGSVKDASEAKRIAEGLLAPAIESLERLERIQQKQLSEDDVLHLINNI